MNVGQIKTALRRYAGVDSTDPLVDWINAAITEFCDAYDWPFLEDIDSGNIGLGNWIITPPADFLRISHIHLTYLDGTFKYLDYKPWTEVEEEQLKIGVSAVSGRPNIYTVQGSSNIFVYPVSVENPAYFMTYEKDVPVVVNDGDVPDIPTRFHYTLVEGAAIRALQAESEEERAGSARTIFEDSIDRHITKLGGRRQSGKLNSVRDVMGYGT